MMNDVLRQRLWRHIESLPEEQVYQALDYIEFLTSKYSRDPVRAPGSSLLRFGERLEDKMRARGVALRAMRGALDAVGTADRVLAGLSEAGRSLLREVEEGLQAEPPQRSLTPGESQRTISVSSTPSSPASGAPAAPSSSPPRSPGLSPSPPPAADPPARPSDAPPSSPPAADPPPEREP